MTTYLSPLLAKAVPTALHDHVKRLLVSALSLGPLPEHVALVMDGNRRYARESGLHVSRGHADGFKALGGVRPSDLRMATVRDG
jgi:ditrans,polycis-polyprenyl diphosphate synthase